MKRIYRHFIPIIIGLFALFACTGKGEKADDEGNVETRLPEEKNTVEVMRLEATEFRHELISNGKLSSRHEADLLFPTAGTVAEIYVRNGDRVRKGQKLAMLDTFRLANAARQARATMEQARLELQDLIIGQGYMLRDTARVPADIMRLVRTKSGFDAAQAAYQLAEYEYRHAVLTAPFDGVVANLFAKPYNTVTTTEAFCTLIDPSSLEATFTLLENELLLVRKGDEVNVSPFAFPEQKSRGVVSEINPLVDDDGMVQLRASVSGGKDLYEGMNVRVSIYRSLGKQLVVPKTAVVLRSGKKVVFTLSSGKAVWNYVQTGLENATHCTISEGLKEGDTVIVSGNINLAHEAPVTVVGEL